MSINCFTNLFKVALTEELLEAAIQLVRPTDISKSLCTDTLCMFNKLINFLTCICRRSVLNIDCTYRAAVFNGTLEYKENYILDSIVNILKLKSETSIRLIRTITIHSICKSQTGEGQLYINIENFLEYTLNKSLNAALNIFCFNE